MFKNIIFHIFALLQHLSSQSVSNALFSYGLYEALWLVSWINVVIGQPLRECFENVTPLTITASLGHGENTPLRQLKQALPLFCVCIRQELFKYGILWHVQKKTQDSRHFREFRNAHWYKE